MQAEEKIGRPVFDESSWAALAALRFAMASIVFLGHLWWFTDVPRPLHALGILGGKAAVLGFLLISGVSIGHSFAERPDGYFVRRFLRIYPLYFVCVCFTQFLIFALPSPYGVPRVTLLGSGWKTAAANLLFLQDFAAVAVTFNSPLWTLSVEVFYMPSRRGSPGAARSCWGCSPAFRWRSSFCAEALVLWRGDRRALRVAVADRLPFRVQRAAADGGRAGRGGRAPCRAEQGRYGGGSQPADVCGRSGGRIPARHLQPAPGSAHRLEFSRGDSYPLYLFHFPLAIALYYFGGIRGPWAFITLVLLLTVAVDYVFDHWLKRCFWKPALRWLLPEGAVAPARRATT